VQLDDQLRGFRAAECQILSFPIDFDRRPYNTLTLLCEYVIYLHVEGTAKKTVPYA